MALLQALISFLSRSVRRVLNAVFGWAVIALFGRTSPKEHLLLTVVVALAAVWPLLLAGVVFPKFALFVLAFVPVFGESATTPMRIFWIVLTLAVPAALGIAIAAKAPPALAGAPWLERALRGVPATLAIAGAFVMMFGIVPMLRIASLVRGRKDEHVPLITHGDQYREVAAVIDRILDRHELGATRSEPPWWLTAPARLMQRLGGKALRSYVPEKLAYWRGAALELALHPGDLLIRGAKQRTAVAHGLVDEALARGPGLMTHEPKAQDIETAIQEIWRIHDENPPAHDDARSLLRALGDVARDVARLEVEYEQWQVVYRKSLQLGRALRGDPQLLEATVSTMDTNHDPNKDVATADRVVTADRPLADVSTRELLKQALRGLGVLSKKQFELATCEARADVRDELGMAKGLAIAFVCALTAINLLLFGLVVTLASSLSVWGAVALVAGAVVSIGGICGALGWARRVKRPLQLTRKTLEEDIRWAKERMT